MDNIEIDETYEMETVEDAPLPNKDTMYKAPPESTEEAMKKAGIK